MSPCTRNSWIAAALTGVLVWLLASGPGGVGTLGALFLGFVTAWLLGGVLVMLFCQGAGGDLAAGDHADAGSSDAWHADDAVAGTGRAVHAPDPRLAALPLATRPAGMPGAPEGASLDATAAATFTAAPGATDAARAPAPAAAQPAAVNERRAAALGAAPAQDAAPGIFSQEASPPEARAADATGPDLSAAMPAAPAPSAALAMDVPSDATPLEDTRAVMEEPSESADHAMPGEAVPAAEPVAPPAPDAEAAGSFKRDKDRAEKGRADKDRSDKDRADKGKGAKGKDGGKDKPKKDKSGRDKADRLAGPAELAGTAAPGSTDAMRVLRARAAEAGAPRAQTLTAPEASRAQDDRTLSDQAPGTVPGAGDGDAA